MTKGTALIVDDDADILLAGRMLLRRLFSTIHTTQDPQDVPALVRSISRMLFCST